MLTIRMSVRFEHSHSCIFSTDSVQAFIYASGMAIGVGLFADYRLFWPEQCVNLSI